jgi:hypothetical protein
VDRGFGEVADFLETRREVRHIVTNPPYNLAEAFIEHALESTTGKVAMLLRLAFLEGQQRHEKWMQWPLKTVWVFSKRISMYPDKHRTGHGLYPYAWYVWDHSHQGQPEIRWISPELMDRQNSSKTTVPSGTAPAVGELGRRVWPTAPDPFARGQVEKWKKSKLTSTEESLRRFFKDKAWSVGGPIPLRLLFGAETISLLDDHQHDGLRQAERLVGRSTVKQLTEQMEARDIDKTLHGGLAMLYVRLCWRSVVSVTE